MASIVPLNVPKVEHVIMMRDDDPNRDWHAIAVPSTDLEDITKRVKVLNREWALTSFAFDIASRTVSEWKRWEIEA